MPGTTPPSPLHLVERSGYSLLNTDRELFPSGPANHFYHGGAGANRVWVSPELDMVVVIRWMSADHFDGFVERVLAAVKA